MVSRAWMVGALNWSSRTAGRSATCSVDVYSALGLDMDPATAAALDPDVTPGVTVDDVERAVIASFGDLEPAALDEETLALAHRLEPLRRT